VLDVPHDWAIEGPFDRSWRKGLGTGETVTGVRRVMQDGIVVVDRRN
jgi:hypothetical protein